MNFENRAADYERQWPFFEKFLQTAGQNDSNCTLLERYHRDTTFSCRTLPLIPYGLRAILKLRKCGHCFFATPKSASVRHPTKNRTASDENRTASDG